MSHRDLLDTNWLHERGEGGRFHCPHCSATRDFLGSRIRRWITVMGRPVVPLGAPEKLVTCQHCGHAYPVAIAAQPAAAAGKVLAEDETALLGVLSAMILSDSAVRSAERAACREVVYRYTGRRLDPDDVSRLLRSARPRWGDPIARLERIRSLVPDGIKRRIIEAAYLICTADRELHSEEGELLVRIGDAMDLGPREVHRAIAQAKRTPVI